MPEVMMFMPGQYETEAAELGPNKTFDFHCPAPEPKPLFNTQHLSASMWVNVEYESFGHRVDRYCFEAISKSQTQTDWQGIPCGPVAAFESTGK